MNLEALLSVFCGWAASQLTGQMANSNAPYSVGKEQNNIPSNSASGSSKEQVIGMAVNEMECVVERFNRLTHTCFNKCVDKRYKDGELTLGECSCIDRCVSKYWQVNNIIGQMLGSGRPAM